MLFIVIAAILLLWAYLRRNDKALNALPESAATFSPKRVTAQDVIQMNKDQERILQISVQDQLPPRTGRRYIVVGGAGFLGGWICVQLLQRGEDPKGIRVLDIHPPKRHDLTTGKARDIDFLLVDMSDSAAVDAAFHKPWPSSVDTQSEITIFHTAANIRFYERHAALLPSSWRVNVMGTQNIINSARAIGASVLVYTSSGSVAVRRAKFWLWPWEKEPKFFVQVINDDDTLLPKRHEEFFSNYAATKMEAERLVRRADKSASSSGKVLRTGCIRPGNGIYGPGGDMLCGSYLVRKVNPSWIHTILQSFIYVENCALAHLCYEQRLLELASGSANPDIGGQAFSVADPGPPQTYGDVYVTLNTLTDGETIFPAFPPSAMLLLAHLIEAYYLTRQLALAAGYSLARWIPPITGALINLQPSLWALTQVHLIFDDSRARLSPEKGGLGYRGGWTTPEALHKTVAEYKGGVSSFDTRAGMGGIPFHSWFRRGIGRVQKTASKLDVDPIHVRN